MSVLVLLHVLHPSAENSKSVEIRVQAKRSTAGVRVGGGVRSLKSYWYFGPRVAKHWCSRRYELIAVTSIDPVGPYAMLAAAFCQQLFKAFDGEIARIPCYR